MLKRLRVTAIFNGHRSDGGYVQEGVEGLERAKRKLDLDLSIVDHTNGDSLKLVELVRIAAQKDVDAIIVHGSRADGAIEEVAPDFPSSRFFSAGGYAKGENIWNYGVRHYEAAFLAGILAARLTKSGIVGHLSGVKIIPGERGRAAYVHGVKYANPEADIVTGFCGNQDDPELARAWTEDQLATGMDVQFTMLNFGRRGAVAACREADAYHIGNVRDLPAEQPDLFVASSIAAHGWSIEAWLTDIAEGTIKAGVNRRAGLETPSAVRLALGPSVSDTIRDEIDAVARLVIAGEIEIASTYDGDEFSPSPPMVSAT